MGIINTFLLLLELLICLIPFTDYKISFGNGEGDFLIFSVIYIGVVIHLFWTIRLIRKKANCTLPVQIFSLFTIFILLKATFWRGPEFPWDGDVIVNKGSIKPDTGNQISYSVIIHTGEKDSVEKINLPDPGNKYLTTLWVSDPECTGCNDCMVDSGKLMIPDTLKNDVHPDDIIFLSGKSPYRIQGAPYVRYRIKGQVMGVKAGRAVFYVSEWKRL